MRAIELEFLQPKPRLIIQNKELIISIHQKLDHFLALLDESEKKADDKFEEMTRIREVMFKAEDEIEDAILEALDEAEILSRVSLFYNETETAHSSLFSLTADCPKTFHETFQSVLHNIQELMDTLQLQDDAPSSSDSSSALHIRHSSKLDEEQGIMVGHSIQFEEVMAHIFRPSLQQRQVMTMVGMGGIGKTTFARKVYDDPRVASHFDLRGWTTVSQQQSVTQILLELGRSISMAEDTNTAAAQLRKSLLGKRYLIILDDIWTENAWDEIKGCFPDVNNGSRILLTTRHKEVTEYADAGEYCFNMCFLDPIEGWELFYQKLHVKEPLNKEFETVGKNIVKKCRGLPLAIVLLAGLLSAGNNSLDEWKNLETRVNSLVSLELGEHFYSTIFTLSYNSLPHYLKACFLYLGVFPEDTEIPIKKLIRLWIAEGFITTLSGKRLEEVGEAYLHDLINRSLVMVNRQSIDGKIKTCKIHDLLLELCVDKITKEKMLFVHQRKYDIYNLDNRWISFKDAYFLFGLPHPYLPRVRFSHLDIISFKRLRVMDLSYKQPKTCNILDDIIVDLVFLRYLTITSCKLLSCIPLRRNWNLQTLIISFIGPYNRKIPRIWDLPQLRHLKCQVPIYQPEVVQENLQTFYWWYDFWCTKQVLLRIPNVKELGIYAQGEQFHPIDNLYLLNHLEKLTTRGNFLLPCLKLPPHVDAFPLSLKNLTIKSVKMEWEDITVVSMLPNLEVLKLWGNGYKGQNWELTQEEGFPRLKALLISSSNLRDWKADGIHDPFPVLEQLLLRDCYGLKEMPSFIEDIPYASVNAV